MSALTVGSLCSGIGGLDLGLERAGMTVRWQAETDPYASQVLAKHWPDVPNHGDITTTDWTTVEPVDLICAGYPCQPFSEAGRGLGSDDPRHLWPAVAVAIRHLRPRWVLLENVRRHLVHGFDRVLADLHTLGFDAEWSLVPACAFGAPHTRDRLFVVANADGERLGQLRRPGRPSPRQGPWDLHRTTAEPPCERVADGVPDRVDRNRGTGNAVVPQVAEHVGSLIVAADCGVSR